MIPSSFDNVEALPTDGAIKGNQGTRIWTSRPWRSWRRKVLFSALMILGAFDDAKNWECFELEFPRRTWNLSNFVQFGYAYAKSARKSYELDNLACTPSCIDNFVKFVFIDKNVYIHTCFLIFGLWAKFGFTLDCFLVMYNWHLLLAWFSDGE